MSQKIHTIQSSDKDKFDKEVNIFLEHDCELLENSYEIIKNDDGIAYSQVVVFDTNKYDVRFFEDGAIKEFNPLNMEGEKHGKCTKYYNDGGKKSSEGIWMNGKKHGYWIGWFDNRVKIAEGTYKDGERDGLWNYWWPNGQKAGENTFKYGKLISKKTWDRDGNLIG